MTVHRPADITHALTALDVPDVVEVLAAAPRLRLRASSRQMTPIARQSTPAINETEH